MSRTWSSGNGSDTIGVTTSYRCGRRRAASVPDSEPSSWTACAPTGLERPMQKARPESSRGGRSFEVAAVVTAFCLTS